MSPSLRVLTQVDDLVRNGVPGESAGYHDQQSPDHYAPAIEHPRHVLHLLLGEVLARGPLRTVIEVGAGRSSVRHHALRCAAECVVTVDPDPARLRRIVGAEGSSRDPGSKVVLGHGHEPAVVAELQRHHGGCDLLLLDGSEHYAGMAACWRALAGLVRPGGTVAIVDRAQAWPASARADDTDRFVADLAERYLRPRGRTLRRHGRMHSVVTYVRTVDDDEAAARWAEPVPQAEPWAEPEPVVGFRISQDGGQWLATRGGPVPCDVRAARRHAAELAFLAASREQLLARLARWEQLEAVAAAGIQALANGDRPAWQALAAVAATLGDGDRAWLTAALQATPRGRALLRVVGGFWLLRGEHELGTALLRQVIELDLGDALVLRALAAAELARRGGEPAARDLLTTVRQRLADRERTRICLRELRGHALWSQPRLLHRRQRLCWIGAGGAEAFAAAQRLDLAMVWLPNDPELAFDDGHGTCRRQLIGAAATSGPWWRDPRDGSLAQRPWCRTCQREQGCTQTVVPVSAVVTLDQLLASGVLAREQLEVLVIDAPGAVHELLRGAAVALQSVQSLCVLVHHQAVFEGSVPHPEVLAWLREQGLHLWGCEPTADPTAAFALLTRNR